ncbi:outer membrane biogenesis protein BamB [compost metagenome]
MYDTKPPVMNGLLYFSAKNTLYAKNIASGQIRWVYNTGEHPQIVTNHSVFFIDSNDQLVKVSASTGKLLWKVKVSERPMEVGRHARLTNGKIYFANESGGVAAYHPVTGKKLWENSKIPMYAGTLYGEYKGVLVVSSSADIQNSYVYSVDGNLDKDEYILTRFTRGANAGSAPKSYEAFGKWLAGPTGAMAFFQKGTQITGVHLADDSVVTFENPAKKVEHLQRVGKAVFAIYEGGDISINHSDTGALLGMIKTGAAFPYFGNITIVNGTALIPTEHNLIAVALPKELQ